MKAILVIELHPWSRSLLLPRQSPWNRSFLAPWQQSRGSSLFFPASGVANFTHGVLDLVLRSPFVWWRHPSTGGLRCDRRRCTANGRSGPTSSGRRSTTSCNWSGVGRDSGRAWIVCRFCPYSVRRVSEEIYLTPYLINGGTGHIDFTLLPQFILELLKAEFLVLFHILQLDDCFVGLSSELLDDLLWTGGYRIEDRNRHIIVFVFRIEELFGSVDVWPLGHKAIWHVEFLHPRE